MTILLAKTFSRFFNGLEYFYISLFDIFSRPSNPFLPFFAPEPSLSSGHFNHWTDDNFAFAGFYFDALSDLQGNLRANVLGNCNLELFADLDCGCQWEPPEGYYGITVLQDDLALSKRSLCSSRIASVLRVFADRV